MSGPPVDQMPGEQMSGGAGHVTVANLMAQACTVSGLTDWGDMSFTAPLGLLIDSCRTTAALTSQGWELFGKVMVRHLRNRLYLEAFLAANPDRCRHPIGSPLIITGLPRTGTTLLHNLLAVDPANRVLRFWEALHPVPTGAGPGPSDQILVTQAETWLARLYQLTPEFRSIHALSAQGPEECDALLQNAFASQHFDDMFRAPSYSDWLNNSALTDEYRHYARQLQALTPPEERGLHWVLKSPGHLGYLDTVLATFPGAVIVHCHRDPEPAIASYASLTLAVRTPHTSDPAPIDVGRHVLNRCTIAVHRALQVRESAAQNVFADVSYTRLVSNPLGVVEELYSRAGRPLSTDVAAAMSGWLAENPQHKHGKHRYALAQFGLTSSEVRRALGPYLEQFGPELV